MLFTACRSGDVGVVRRVLGHPGMDVNKSLSGKSDWDGNTRRHGFGNASGFTPLHFSAWYGHKKVMELLITKGVKNVNAKVLSGAKKGYTPLDLTFLNLEMAKI